MKQKKLWFMNTLILISICIFLMGCSKDENKEEPVASVPETSNVFIFASDLNTNLITAGLSDTEAKVISDAAMLEATPLVAGKIANYRNLRGPENEDISLIAQAIAKGAMKSIPNAGLAEALTFLAIGAISKSPIQSLGRIDTLSEDEKKIMIISVVKTCTGLLDDAGVESGDIIKATLGILDAAYIVLEEAGITNTTAMLEDMKTEVKEGLNDVAGFDSESAIGSIDGYEPPVVATPTFDVAGGTYSATQLVTISTSKADAVIWYTTDGTVPTCGTGTEYTSTVSISATSTLKAMACLIGWTDSSVASAAYTIIPKTITVTAPNLGDESWINGASSTITWTSTGNITTVNIELWKKGVKDSDIAIGVVNNGSFTGTILGAGGSALDYRVRIIDASDSNVYDESDADFELFIIPA